MTDQLMPIEKFECLMTESLAHLEESARVHEMFVMPLLMDAITMRLDRRATSAFAIYTALGDSWCMDNDADRAAAVDAIMAVLDGSAQEAANNE